ncbi:N-6 DNA methylase [Saccharomonospora xinjiangensis]|uniref:N-6 DNA methylase n=1 Tax=Saccharomonospora xinjiangensis TaxID=75294 RepID=UPI00350FA623
MSDGTLVTAAEIARMASVGRGAVSNWRRRHTDFPAPVAGPGGTPVFRLDEVEQWLRERGKLTGSGPSDTVWRALEGDANVLERIADVATYLHEPGTTTLPEGVRRVLGDLDARSRDELVESLCGRAFERQQRQHLVSPPELARLMVELAGPVTGTVFDPACGPGNILRAAAEAGAERLAGQELDPVLARLARARLQGSRPATIVDGDALRADAFSELRADAVVCDPPFGYRDWGHEELGIDPRWEYGVPVKGEPELAWVQHCLAHVTPEGTVVVALPAGVAFRRSGRAIRQALLRRGGLRAMIALPAGVLMSTGIAVHLWVLRDPGTRGAEPVLLVDTGHHQPPRRGQVDWNAIHRDVLGSWQEFRKTGTVEEVPGQRKVVEPIELLDEDVDLTPARHLPQQPTALDLDVVDQARERLVRSLNKLGDLLPTVREARQGGRTSTTISDLARAGALVLRQQLGPLDTAETGDGPRVLTGRDVATGREPTERYAGDRDDVVPLRPGDLVVPLLAAGGGKPATRVIEADDLVLGPNLCLIRVDPTKLDVHFLAGQIRGGSTPRGSSTTASGVHRIDVRRAEIPVLDLGVQRRLGAAFRRLVEFTAGLRDASDVGERLARQLTDGLADGAVVPGE